MGITPGPLSTPRPQHQTTQAGRINLRTFQDNTLVFDDDVDDMADAISDYNISLPDPDGDTIMPDADDPLADPMAFNLNIRGIDHRNGNTRNDTINDRTDDD